MSAREGQSPGEPNSDASDASDAPARRAKRPAPKSDAATPRQHAGEGWREHPESSPHSWGNVSEHHWTRTRREKNRDALEHLRERSRAPGVAEGGGARNHYCLRCHGVIPLVVAGEGAAAPRVCPHCGVELDERVRAMFNWVEIDETPAGDARALARVALIGLAVVILAGALAWWVLR